MIQTYMNEDIFEKLEMSKTEVTELTLRDLRCPNCRFLIDKIYSDMVDKITANQNELTFHLLGGLELKEKM